MPSVARRAKSASKLATLGLYDPTCSAVTTQSKSTPSLAFEAAKRSSSQLVRTPSRKRSWSRWSDAVESGNAGQSATEPPNRAASSSVGWNPSSPPTSRRPWANSVR